MKTKNVSYRVETPQWMDTAFGTPLEEATKVLNSLKKETPGQKWVLVKITEEIIQEDQ